MKVKSNSLDIYKLFFTILMFSLFLNNEVFFIQIGSYSIRPFMIIVLACLLIIGKIRIAKNSSGVHLITTFLVLFIFCVVPVFYSPYFTQNPILFFRGAILLVFQILTLIVIVFLIKKIDPIEIRAIIKKVLLFNLIISILLFTYHLLTKGTLINESFLGINYTYESIPRMLGLFGDPNYFALYVTVFLWIYIYLAEFNVEVDKKVVALSIVSILLAQSRAVIIANLIGIGIIFVWAKFPKKNWKYIIYMLIIFVITIISIPKDFLFNSFERFNFGEDASFSDRYGLLIVGLENIYRYPFGVGIGYIEEYYKEFYGSTKVAHNDFISIFIEGGIVSLILYLLIFGLILIKSNKMAKIIIIITFVILNTLTAYYFDPIIPLLLGLIASISFKKTTLK